MTLFEFTCYINPPTKNEKDKLRVWSKTKNRYVYVVNSQYTNAWNSIKDQLYISRYDMSYGRFKLLSPKDRNKLRKSLYEGNVSVTIFNGFKRMDTSAFLHELEDQLQGVVYKNDNCIKHIVIFKDDDSLREYFKIIVEEME